MQRDFACLRRTTFRPSSARGRGPPRARPPTRGSRGGCARSPAPRRCTTSTCARRISPVSTPVYAMAEVALAAIDLVTLQHGLRHGRRPRPDSGQAAPARRRPGPAPPRRRARARRPLGPGEPDQRRQRGPRLPRGVRHVRRPTASYVRRDYDFKLIEEVPGYGGSVYLRTTDEAVNVLVGALDTDVTSAQIAAEVKLEVLISRGRLADAQLAAEQARYRTVQYAETLRRTLDATRRNVRAVDWLNAVPDMIAEALDHVADRYRHENAILTNIRKARDEAEDPEHKRRAAELVDIVKDCIRRHTQLQSRLLEAGPLFRAEQDRQAFATPDRPRPASTCTASCVAPAAAAARRAGDPRHRRVLRPRHGAAHAHVRTGRRPGRHAAHPAPGAGAPRRRDARAGPDRHPGRQPVQRGAAGERHGAARSASTTRRAGSPGCSPRPAAAIPTCPIWSPCWPSTRPARRSARPTGRARSGCCSPWTTGPSSTTRSSAAPT